MNLYSHLSNVGNTSLSQYFIFRHETTLAQNNKKKHKLRVVESQRTRGQKSNKTSIEKLL